MAQFNFSFRCSLRNWCGARAKLGIKVALHATFAIRESIHLIFANGRVKSTAKVNWFPDYSIEKSLSDHCWLISCLCFCWFSADFQLVWHFRWSFFRFDGQFYKLLDKHYFIMTWHFKHFCNLLMPMFSLLLDLSKMSSHYLLLNHLLYIFSLLWQKFRA